MNDDASIVFRYTPTADDYRKGIASYYFRQTSFLILIGIAGLMFLIGVFLWIGAGFEQAPYAPLLVFLLPILLFFSVLLQPWLASRQVNKNERMRTETTWTVSDDGLLVTTGYGQSKIDWETFGKVVETGDYFLLLYSWNRRLFQIIPKRAFASPDEMADFREYLKRHIKDYRA